MKIYRSLRLMLALLYLVCTGTVFAQSDSTGFKFKGEPILRVFANFHTGLANDDLQSAFEVERAYLGYIARLRHDLEIKVNLDIGSPDDISEFSRIRRYAYFKNAALKYTWKFITVDFGLIDMQHFKYQEHFWGYRYIERSFSDRFRFGPSADLGADLVLDVHPMLSLDLTLSNGEGYSNLQRDNTLKFGTGFILKPLKGLSLRVYGDIMSKDVIEGTLATFIGYEYKDKFRVAFEYNRKFNADFKSGHDQQGYSAYGTYVIIKKLEVFARYDWITSNILNGDDNPWNLASDGSSVIGGIQYQPFKKLNLALNYRDWVPYAENVSNEYYIYLNLEFKY